MRVAVLAAAPVLATWAAFSFGHPAHAQQQCSTRERALDFLSDRYGESPVAAGVTSTGKLVEVLRSGPQTGSDTWTIIITDPKGLTCLLSAGEGWRDLKPAAPDERT